MIGRGYVYPLPGGGLNLTGASSPRPLTFSRRDFFYVGRFFRVGHAMRSASHAASSSDASQASASRIASLRPATADLGHDVNRGYCGPLKPFAAAINFPCVGSRR